MTPITIPRTIALLTVAVLAALTEGVGPNRYWLGVAVVFWAGAMAWRDVHIKKSTSEWWEVFLDMLFVVAVVNLVPQMWHIAAILGAMIVQTPATVAQPRGFRMYVAAAVTLLAGLAISGYLHNPPLWQLTLGCMAGMYFPIVLFAHWQAARHLHLQAKASTIDSMRRMAGGVAHDFNNYLTGVLGNAELARAELSTQQPNSSNRVMRQALENVIIGTDKTRELARQLLSFSRATRNSNTLVDLQTELQSLVELLRSQPPKTTALSFKNNDTAEQSLVLGNPGTLQQLFMNLIINATESGTTEADTTKDKNSAPVSKPINVEVSLERVVNDEPADDQLSIVIRDNGRGIDDAIRKKMFEPFVTTKDRGHGLGLAAAKEIAERHGGTIQIESEVGTGTCVKVLLPSARSDEPPQPTTPAPVAESINA